MSYGQHDQFVQGPKDESFSHSALLTRTPLAQVSAEEYRAFSAWGNVLKNAWASVTRPLRDLAKTREIKRNIAARERAAPLHPPTEKILEQYLE